MYRMKERIVTRPLRKMAIPGEAQAAGRKKESILSVRLAKTIMGACAIALIAFISYLSYSTLKNSLDIEEAIVYADLDRVTATLDYQMKALATTLKDYAHWDDCYAVVHNQNADFVEANFAGAVFDNLGIDFVAAYADDGRLFLSNAREGLPPLADIPAGFLGNTGLFSPDSNGKAKTGLMRLGSQVFAVASIQSTRSDESGPAAGLIVFGKAVDAKMASQIATLSGTSLEFVAASPDAAPLSPRSVQRSSTDKPVVGRAVLSDAEGLPILLAQVTKKRTVYAHGQSTVFAMIAASILIFGTVFIAFRISMTVLLLRPIGRLEVLLASGEAEERIPDGEIDTLGDRRDLIGHVARIIKTAQLELRRSLQRQESISEDLDKQVHLRTFELVEANHSLAIYKRLMEETSEGVLITDIEGRILEANASFCATSLFSREELLGQNPRIMKSDRHEAEFFRLMWESVTRTGSWKGEIWDRRKDGSLLPKLLSIDTIRGEDGKPEQYIGVSADLSGVKLAEEHLSKIAFYDSLTGLPNRILFLDRLSQVISRVARTDSRAALLYLDLDRFKNINDSYGHLAGDAVLCEAGRRISGLVRKTDTVCRLGGDEFAVVLESIIRDRDALMVSEKIIAAMSAPFLVNQNPVYIGVSIGIALIPSDGSNSEDLVRLADTAMYEAKEQGRGQVRFASAEAGKESLRRVTIEAGLRRGLEQGEFLVYYQPQVGSPVAAGSSSLGLVGAEALVRWKPDSSRIIPPGEFINIAEDTGIIIPLGGLVLREACIEARRWMDWGHPLQVSVNVSQRQFEQGQIIQQVRAALGESALPPKLLKLEVTESLFMRDMGKASQIMTELNKLGVTFALDDFGTGYSSLQYIDKLPIDCLKIDKSFIDRISHDGRNREIVMAIISFARTLGLVSVAEGVETAEQLAVLKTWGCDQIQGYHISRPLGAAAFRSFLDHEEKTAAPSWTEMGPFHIEVAMARSRETQGRSVGTRHYAYGHPLLL